MKSLALPKVPAALQRRQAFPARVSQASAQDWARMGQRYLALSAHWRSSRAICTDKLPENWLLAGAALAMLPGARVIDCRRDALETCWSCFKQLFAPGRAGFTYSLEHLAFVVVVPAAPIPITNSIDGVYINLVTGVTGASGPAVPGWDMYPYNNGGGLTF